MTHRRLVAMAVLLMATAVSSWAVASPNGLGSEADQGCLCHTPEASTSVQVEGLPEAYASNTSYALTLTVSSPIEPAVNASQGGFRWKVDEGTLSPVNNSTVQELDGRLVLAEIDGTIAEVFKITKLDRVFAIHDTAAEARADLR